MRYAAKFVQIRNDHTITRKSDREFLFAYQKCILLALAEQGILNDAQYRYAEDKLRQQLAPSDQ